MTSAHRSLVKSSAPSFAKYFGPRPHFGQNFDVCNQCLFTFLIGATTVLQISLTLPLTVFQSKEWFEVTEVHLLCREEHVIFLPDVVPVLISPVWLVGIVGVPESLIFQ